MSPIQNSGPKFREEREILGLSQAKLSEISGVPQYLLSAFELGKTELQKPELDKLRLVFDSNISVKEIIRRKKRYKKHEYTKVNHNPARVQKHTPTKGNQKYKDLIKQLSEAKNPPKYSAISLFSGCGGFSLGFSWAGVKVKGYLELDNSLSKMYDANFPDAMRLGSDITALSDADIRNAYQSIGDVDLILGGPPCQGFSLSGKRDVADPRNLLFKHYLRFVDIFKPKVAVIENVKLLTSMKNSAGKLVKDEIRHEFIAHGYQVDFYEINAKDYGIPEHRERVIFIAVRNDLKKPPSFPPATHGFTKQPYRTFADACSDLAYLESGEKSNDPLHSAVNHPKHVLDWLWDVKEGYSAHDNVDPSMRPPSGYNTTYKRQVWLEPAATVQTTFGMISGCRNVHPIATRSLTIREAARIQSFPDNYKFIGSQGVIRIGIGNAVPPLLAYAIAVHITGSIL